MFFINYRPMCTPTADNTKKNQIALCTVYFQEEKIVADGLFQFTFVQASPKDIFCVFIEENPIRLDDLADAEQIETYEEMVKQKTYVYACTTTMSLKKMIMDNASTISEQYADH